MSRCCRRPMEWTDVVLPYYFYRQKGQKRWRRIWRNWNWGRWVDAVVGRFRSGRIGFGFLWTGWPGRWRRSGRRTGSRNWCGSSCGGECGRSREGRKQIRTSNFERPTSNIEQRRAEKYRISIPSRTGHLTLKEEKKLFTTEITVWAAAVLGLCGAWCKTLSCPFPKQKSLKPQGSQSTQG